MLIKKIIIITIFLLFANNTFANTPRSTGKYKNWESFTVETDKGKIGFAQTLPTKRAPSSILNQYFRTSGKVIRVQSWFMSRCKTLNKV